MTTDLAAPLAELLTALRDAGLSADTDPSGVNLPGCWVALDEVRPITLDRTLELRCRVFLIVPDTDTMRALEALAKLHGQVTAILTPDGPVVTQGVVMPGDPTPLPALSVPVNLYTEGS